MDKPTGRCLKYARDTGAEVWVDDDGTYYMAYPDARTAHKHGLAAYDMFVVTDDDMFEIRSISKSILRNLPGARRVEEEYREDEYGGGVLVWFTSDPHFSCPSTLAREHRPFENTDDYDKHVIDVWNSQVKKKDVIYVLGDFTSSTDGVWQKGLARVKDIKAHVVLVMGNNETRIMRGHFGDNYGKFKNYCIRLGFKDVVNQAYVKCNGRTYFLVHVPCRKDLSHITLFGHVHKGVGVYKPFGFNMFLDMNYFRLYGQDDLERLIDQRTRYWQYSPNIYDMEKADDRAFLKEGGKMWEYL